MRSRRGAIGVLVVTQQPINRLPPLQKKETALTLLHQLPVIVFDFDQNDRARIVAGMIGGAHGVDAITFPTTLPAFSKPVQIASRIPRCPLWL